MNARVKRTIRKIRLALLSSKARETLVFLFFLSISYAFWLLQTLNESFDVRLVVPLRLTGVPENVVVTTPPPGQVYVSVHDRGTSLMRYLKRKELAPIDVDFATYDEGASSARVQIPLQDIQRAVMNQLNATSHIQAVHPDTVEYYFNRGQSLRLPVGICGKVTTTPQNYLVGMRPNPDSVTVYAPVQVLDTMQAVYVNVSLAGLTENTSVDVSPRVMKGVCYEPSSIKVTALVDYYTEKTVEVPIIGLNFPGDKVLRTFPNKARVTFKVGASQFGRYSAENFVLAATYEELIQNPSLKYRLHLKSLPSGVSNVRIVPQEIDYLIEQTDEPEEGEE
ncbi:MAG: CdaR family protein [Bacteroidaceae bacterium]